MRRLLLITSIAFLLLPTGLSLENDEGPLAGGSSECPTSLYLSLDEDRGQLLHDYSGMDYPNSGLFHLGSTESPDSNDPSWSGNTMHGFCLDFSPGQYVTGPNDLKICLRGDWGFYLQLKIYLETIEGKMALLSFEDSDDELYGMFVDGGHFSTIWAGHERIAGPFVFELFHWYDVTYWYNGSGERIWIDGRCIYDDAVSNFKPKMGDYDSMYLGAFVDSGKVLYPFDGMMDELRIDNYRAFSLPPCGIWNFQGSADRIEDRSGWDNDGICSNIEDGDFVPGVSGNCLRLDGNDERIDVIPDGILPLDDGWKISLWVKPGTLSEKESLRGISNVFMALADEVGEMELGLLPNASLEYSILLGEGAPHSSYCAPLRNGWSRIDINHWASELGPSVSIDVNSIRYVTIRFEPAAGSILGLGNGTRLRFGGSVHEPGSFFNGCLDEAVLFDASIDSVGRSAIPDTAHLRFEGNARDSSAYGSLHFQDRNVEYSSLGGKFRDQCAYFDGAYSNISKTDTTPFLNEDELHVQFWIKPLSPGSAVTLVAIGSQEEWRTTISLTENGSVGMFTPGYDPLVSRGKISFGQWNHIYAAYGANLELHLNGILDNYRERKWSLLQGVDDLILIGSDIGPIPSHYHGYMDDLIFTKRYDFDQDTDLDGMPDRYEVIRSLHSKNYNEREFNGRYALIIGNNDNTSDKDVGYAVSRDAFDMRSYLTSVGYSDNDIVFLTYRDNVLKSVYRDYSFIDGNSTRSNVMDGLDELSRISQRSDTVLLYYSGHGDQEEDIDEDEDCFDFTTHEKTIRLDERLALKDGLDGPLNPITDDVLSKKASSIKAKQMIIMIVSCSSGGFLEDIEQAYALSKDRPWDSYTVLVPAHESDVAFVKNMFASFFSQSIVNKCLRRTDTDDWSDRDSFGRVAWDPDKDVTLANMKFLETDGIEGDYPTLRDDPSHWQRNHYTEDGYQPGWQKTDKGQDFPDQLYGWGEYDNCTRWVSSLDYSPSNGDGIIDLEEAFYYSTHNEYLEEGSMNPEADPNALTDLGDDPLIYDSDPHPDMKVSF